MTKFKISIIDYLWAVNLTRSDVKVCDDAQFHKPDQGIKTMNLFFS